MFRSAKIKLTFWYLVIIMAISLSFSAVIYRGVTLEFQRRLNIIERRFNVETPRGWRMQGPVHDYFLEDLNQARNRVLFLLLYASGVILVLSATAGYFLAGKTLKPIENVLEEQKRFVADASHELKTPLTALQTSIEVTLRDKKLNLNGAKKVLAENLDDIDSLKKLSNDLLALTSYQQNGDKMTKTKVSVRETVESAYKKIRPLARKKDIKITLKMKEAKLIANKESLEKLITILLDNAVKYTNKGGRVSLSTSKGRRYFIIRVKDNGIGISKRDLPHIFDRFYQADQSRSKLSSGGSGLGLSIAKRIVKLHGGSIKADSVINKGSTFTVRLPL